MGVSGQSEVAHHDAAWLGDGLKSKRGTEAAPGFAASYDTGQGRVPAPTG